MKEYLSNVDCEAYDQIVYPQMVMGYLMMIRDMFSDDILILPNPERNNYLKPSDEPPVETPPVNPLQGEFKLWSK